MARKKWVNLTKGKYKIIQSVARAFSIIDCFTEEDSQLSLNEISRKTQLNINTTRGLVQTLLHFDYLAFDEKQNKFRLGLIFIEKSEIAHFEYTKRIIDLVQGNLQQIADNYFVSIRMMSIENTQVSTVVECTPAKSRYALIIHDSTEFPLYASATGKIILAYAEKNYRDHLVENFDWKQYGKNTHTSQETLEKELEKINQTGVSLEEEELGVGFSSIAVPIFKDDELEYSISVTTTVERLVRIKKDIIKDLKAIKSKIIQNVEELN